MRATFSIDEKTQRALERVALSLGKSKSEVVREAVVEYEARRDRLTEEERQAQLAALAKLKLTPPAGTEQDETEEIEEIRATRRSDRRNAL
jgi:Arc/MetJ-type ribon-helix-helix transcriptional regulator